MLWVVVGRLWKPNSPQLKRLRSQGIVKLSTGGYLAGLGNNQVGWLLAPSESVNIEFVLHFEEVQ